MIGDNDTDMEFGSRLGMKLIKLGDAHKADNIKTYSTLSEATIFLIQLFEG